MKKSLWIILAGLFILALSSCEKLDEDYQNLPDPSENDGTLSLKSSSAFIEGDTIFTLVNQATTCKIETTFISPSNYTVTPSVGNPYVVTDEGYFTFNLVSVGLSSLTVTATDLQGAVHTRTYIVKAMSSLDEMGPVRFISSTSNGSGGYNIVFAVYKNAMLLDQNSFGYVGSGTQWTPMAIAPADTNYRIGANNTIIAVPPTTQYASWIAVRCTNIPGDYMMGVGKFNSTNTTLQYWGNFLGSQYATDPANTTMLYYTVHPNGAVTPPGGTTTELPGKIGDAGPNGAVRLEQNPDDTWTLFVNNGAAFSTLASPFFSIYSNDVWGQPVAQQPVTGYPNWGKMVITADMFVNYGSNTSSPTAFNPLSEGSMFYDSRYNALSIGVGNLSVLNK
ncbi:MAG: hypothetical protein ACM3PZ_02805 [Bacillota bacterium]